MRGIGDETEVVAVLGILLLLERKDGLGDLRC
jgi:hypothetical protein